MIDKRAAADRDASGSRESALGALIVRLRRSDVVRHGALVFAAMLGANALTYLFYAGTTRSLGVVASGALNSLLSAMLLLSVPAIAGATVIAAITADARARADWAGYARLSRRVMVYGTAVAATVVIAALTAWTAIAAYLHLTTPRTVALAALGAGLTIVLPLQRGILQGAGAFGSFAASNMVEALPKLIFGIALSMSTLRLDGALAGYAAAVGLAYAFNWWAIAQLRRDPGTIVPPARSRPLHALRVIAPVAAINVMTFYDVVLVRHAFPGREAGLYVAAALVGRALLTVIAFVPTVILPKAADRIRRDRSAALRLLGLAVAASGAIVVTGVGACAIFPVKAVTLIAGNAFSDAAPIVVPYALAMAALAGASVLANFLIGAGLLGFAVPLALVAAAEVAGVALVHPSLRIVLLIVDLGHFAALAVTVAAIAMWARKKNYG